MVSLSFFPRNLSSNYAFQNNKDLSILTILTRRELSCH